MRGLITRGKTVGCALSFLLISFLCAGQTTPAQVAKNQTFTTFHFDYEAMGFNPANLSANRREGKRLSLGLMNTNFLLYNGPLKRDLLHNRDMSRLADPAHWFDDILVERTHIAMDNTILGLNFHTKRAGSFGLNIRTLVQAEVELNGAFEDLQFEGTSFSNLPEIIMTTIQENPDDLPPGDMSVLRMSVVNEFGAAYSRKIVATPKVQLHGGIGVKYLMGFADVGIQFNNHQVAGIYSLSSILPDGFGEDSTSGDVQSGQKFSHGFGISGGTSLRWKKLKAGLSVTDLGFIKWPMKEMFVTKEDVVGEVLTEDEINDAISNAINDFQRNADGKEWLPGKIIFGASYDIHKYVSFYMDFIAPLNDSPRNMTRPTIGVGTWLSLKHVLTLRTGANLIDKKIVALPMYFSLFAGKKKTFEMSVGTSDFLAFFLEGREYMQAETAMMKFHF